METLVHKSSGPDRTLSTSASSHVQYSSMSNTNAPLPSPVTPATQVIIPQSATISKAAKPVRDSAQFVSDAQGSSDRIASTCLSLQWQVDLVSAVLFPVAFIVFNIIYW